MKNMFRLVLISLLVTSCQTPVKTVRGETAAMSHEEYQNHIREEKRKQAELDLPYRGLAPHRTLDRIAFSSGMSADSAHPKWSMIEKSNPELMILTSAADVDVLRVPEYRSIREKVPFMASWYEHEDSGPEARRDFVRAWPYVRNILAKTQDGLYHAQIFGTKKDQVQVILLDPSEGGISPHQWSWIEEQLKKSVALKIIANVPEEDTQLRELISRTGAKNLILIPGSRPVASLSRGAGILCEVSAASAGRTISSVAEAAPYGLIQIDWSRRTASVEIRSDEDRRLQSLNLKF